MVGLLWKICRIEESRLVDQGVIWGMAPSLVADWRGSSTSESIGGHPPWLGRERAKRRLQIDIEA